MARQAPCAALLLLGALAALLGVAHASVMAVGELQSCVNDGTVSCGPAAAGAGAAASSAVLNESCVPCLRAADAFDEPLLHQEDRGYRGD